jgi:oxygen-dependent protoporphyrinogen oxidase
VVVLCKMICRLRRGPCILGSWHFGIRRWTEPARSSENSRTQPFGTQRSNCLLLHELENDGVVNIAIIGAGVSGLTCAWYLERLLPNAQIDLIEASDCVGGVIQTHHEPSYLAELGADNIATLVPDGLKLIEAMGIRNEFVSPNPKYRFAQVVQAGRVYPIPNGFSLMQPTQMAAILMSPILSLSGRLRILGEYFIKARSSNEDESVESFAVRRLGRECFDRLVEPIIGGIFTARSETLSMQATMAQFVEMEKKHGGLIRAAFAKRKSEHNSDTMARKATGARYDQFMAPKLGMSWWMNTIKSQLNSNLYLSTKVNNLAYTQNGKLKIATSHATLLEKEYDHICVATPGWVASQLIEGVNSEASALLARIPYASSAVAILAIRKSEIRPGSMCFGIVVPKVENRDVLAISLTSEKYPSRCPDDTVLARVFLGGAVRPELMDQSDESLLRMAIKESQSLLGVTSAPTWQKLIRWNCAMPQYLIGHCTSVAEIRKHLEKTKNLSVIGNALDGVGIPQCIRLARTTAEKIASALVAPILMLAFLIGMQGNQRSHATQEESQATLESVKFSNAEDAQLRHAFENSHDGWSVDEILLHDERRAHFLNSCRELQTERAVKRSEKELLQRLVQLRKSDKLDVKSTRRADSDVDDFLIAAEIASRLMHDRYSISSDQWLVDPSLLQEFDSIGLAIADSKDSYSLRKAALKLRKSRALKPELLQRVTDWHVTIHEVPIREAMENLDAISEQPGVYIFRDNTGYLYIGQSNNLRTRLTKHLSGSDRKALAKYLGGQDLDRITLEMHVFGPGSPALSTTPREAYESELIRSRKPRFNLAP